jgi:hypothetical protein
VNYQADQNCPSKPELKLIRASSLKDLKEKALKVFKCVWGTKKSIFLSDPRKHPWGDQSDCCDHMVYNNEEEECLLLTEVIPPVE